MAGQAGEQIQALSPGGLSGVQSVPELARLLRQLRRREARRRGESELTYRELAAKTGWSRGIIGEYLAGKVLPPTDRFDVLIGLLGATPAEQGALATVRDRVEERRRSPRAVTPGAAAEPPPPHTPPVPQELPADVFGFTGRLVQLSELDALLGLRERTRAAASAVVISAVSGTGGVGKTALAVHWAHRVADHFPDGQLYVDLRGYDPEQPVPAAAALAGFLRSLGVPGADVPADLGERAARFRSLVAGRRMLIVLDNARAADQVRPLLPGAASCLVLVTSRDDLAGLVARDGARRLDLDVLSTSDSVELLRTLIGRRVDIEPTAAAALAHCCARLPLALRVAAELAVARGQSSLADLVEDLRHPNRLDVLDARSDARTDPRAAVRAVFSWSLRHLSAPAGRVFALIGLHPGQEIDDYAVAALAGLDLAPARTLVDDLARAQLVTRSRLGRATLHDLLRAYARERAEADLDAEEREAAQTRLFDLYRYTASAAMDALFPLEAESRPRLAVPGLAIPPVDTATSARSWLECELANLVAVAEYAVDHARPEYTLDLSRTLFRYLDAHGHYLDALSLHSAAVRATREDGPDRASALNSLGLVYLQLGRTQDALEFLQRLRESHRHSGDRPGEARVLGTLGQVYERLGRYAESVDHLNQSLQMHRADGQLRREAMQLGNLGVLYQRMGRYAEAQEVNERSAAIFRETGDERYEAYVLANTAVLRESQGRLDEALALLDQALEAGRRYDARELEAQVLTTLGSVYRRIGRLEEAVDQLELALAIARAIGERAQEVEALNTLGETVRDLGDPAAALEHHQVARAMARQIGYRREYARAQAGMGSAWHEQGHPDRAQEHWREARAIYTELGIPDALAQGS